MIEPSQQPLQPPQPWTPHAEDERPGVICAADAARGEGGDDAAGDDAAGEEWEEGEAWEAAAAEAATSSAEKMDGKRLVNWLKPNRSEVERARDSERYFWLKVMVLLGFFSGIAAAGIVRVQHTTGGVRVAYELVKTNDELRIKLEANRRLEAVLTGLKNPNALRREAGDKFEMHAPAASEVLEVN